MTTEAATPAACLYHRRNPFSAELIEHRRLSRRGSEKDIRHFVLSLAGSGLCYRPGDSLGIYARNSPALVDEIIKALGSEGERLLGVRGPGCFIGEMSLLSRDSRHTASVRAHTPLRVMEMARAASA